MKLKRILFFITLVVICLGLGNCTKTNPVDELIPYAEVNFSINPASLQFDNLNVVGNYAYVTGGYRGIIIYHATLNEYKAFERTSPYDYPNSFECRVSVDDSGLIAVDQCSGSKYILLDGSPFEGPATLPLKQYNAVFDGAVLHVFN